MAICRPEASDATSPRGPRRVRDGVRIATAAQWRTAQARLCCFARNDGDPGSPRSARGGRRQGKKVGPSRCGIGARGAAVLRPDQAIEEAVRSGHGRMDDGEAVALAPVTQTRPANMSGRCPEAGQAAHSPSLQRRECSAPRGLSAATRPPSSTRTNLAASEGKAGAPVLRSLPAQPGDADGMPFVVWCAERLSRRQGGELCPSEGRNAFLPVMRTKATTPTTPAPRIENTICHGREGMVCFRMPWVA